MIKITTFTCPECKKGNAFIVYNFDDIKCNSCDAIIPNPIFRENKPFFIEFIEDIIVVDLEEIKG